MNNRRTILWAVLGAAALCLLLMALPPIQERVWWRLDQLRVRIFYAINPPEESVFTPQGTSVASVVEATLTAMALQVSPTAAGTLAPTSTPLPPDVPTPTATASPSPLPTLPPSASIKDVPYVDQHYGFNNCAPATLTMALKFWGWQGDREGAASYLKPYAKDKNVMPYELTDFVNGMTDYRALDRVGGTPEILKRLVVNGYPVVVERGVYLRDLSGKVSWMGHYQYVYGYDDAASQYQVKDAFEENGSNFRVSYDDLTIGWRSFNYHYMVVYPPDREADVLALLGDQADEAVANRAAYEKASEEIFSLTGQDQFFAWYNQGSSLVRLQDFGGAAKAYDQAFTLLAELPADKRPWRTTWYMTGPYYAYYYTGRHYDVIALADKTIGAASEPFLEESFYWRARAKAALGDTTGAADDLRKSLEYHPDFSPSVAMMAELGITP